MPRQPTVEQTAHDESGDSEDCGKPLAVGGRQVGIVEQDRVMDEVANDDAAASEVAQPGQATEPADTVADGDAELVRCALGHPLVLTSGGGITEIGVSKFHFS